MKRDSVAAIIRALNQAKVEYLLVGGLAVNAWNFVRPTKDVDLVIRLRTENLARALPALECIGYRPHQHVSAAGLSDPLQRKQWREQKGMLVLKMWSDAHLETPLDIFIEEPFDFLKEYARALPHQIEPGLEAPVVTLGTLLKMKKSAGRPQDREDVRALEDLYGL